MTEQGQRRTCPICRILEAAQGQQLAVAVALFRAVTQVRCYCPTIKHHGLLAHPHEQPGCRGYQPGESYA